MNVDPEVYSVVAGEWSAYDRFQ